MLATRLKDCLLLRFITEVAEGLCFILLFWVPKVLSERWCNQFHMGLNKLVQVMNRAVGLKWLKAWLITNPDKYPAHPVGTDRNDICPMTGPLKSL